MAREIRRYRPEDAAEVVALLTSALPRWERYRDPAAVWHWKHFANPFGASRVLVAIQEGRIVGTSSMLRWGLRRGEHSVTAMRSVDLATDPALQRSGIASQIAKAGFVELKQMGLPLGFYTPNQNSSRLAQRDGRKSAGMLEAQVRVRRPLRALRAWWRAKRDTGPAHGAEALSAFRGDPIPVEVLLRDERGQIEALLAADRARDVSSFHTAHSWESLYWRYAQHPGLRYWAVATRRQGRLEGCLIFRAEEHHSAHRVVLEDLLLRNAEPAALRALRAELDAVVSADLVQAQFPEAIARDLLGRGLRLHAKGYQLVIRVMDPSVGLAPFARENWQLTLGDLREI